MALRELGESKQLEQFLLSCLAKREVTDIVHKYAKPYKELMAYYRCAMMEVSAKFNVLNEEPSLQYDRNPIETIKTRLKSPESIVEKLQRRGYPLTVESIEKNLNDVAGVRVICSYTSDIYMLADAFIRQDDITLLERKDYGVHFQQVLSEKKMEALVLSGLALREESQQINHKTACITSSFLSGGAGGDCVKSEAKSSPYGLKLV